LKGVLEREEEKAGERMVRYSKKYSRDIKTMSSKRVRGEL
jgi:hypothetical protein